MRTMVVAMSLFLFATSAWGASITIGPFPNMETAAKGEILKQLNDAVKEIKAAGKKGKIPKITLIGSADKTGPESKNDSYSRNRAETVKGYLEASFPDARFIIVPAGSELNSREVRIDYEYVFNHLIILSAVAGILLVLSAIVLLRRKKPETVIQKKQYGPALEFNAGDYRYRRFPEINGTQFVGLRKIEVDGEFVNQLFSDYGDLRKSDQDVVKRLLRESPGEVKRMLFSKQLTVIGPAEGRNNEKNNHHPVAPADRLSGDSNNPVQ